MPVINGENKNKTIKMNKAIAVRHSSKQWARRDYCDALGAGGLTRLFA